MPDFSNVELIARQLLGGLWISVQIFVLTLVFTFPFGLVVALGRMSWNAVLLNVTRI